MIFFVGSIETLNLLSVPPMLNQYRFTTVGVQYILRVSKIYMNCQALQALVGLLARMGHWTLKNWKYFFCQNVLTTPSCSSPCYDADAEHACSFTCTFCEDLKLQYVSLLATNNHTDPTDGFDDDDDDRLACQSCQLILFMLCLSLQQRAVQQETAV